MTNETQPHIASNLSRSRELLAVNFADSNPPVRPTAKYCTVTGLVQNARHILARPQSRREPLPEPSPLMINLSDLSVVIPFRCDSAERLQNLRTILRYFTRFASGHELIVVENGPSSAAASLTEFSGVRYFFEENEGPFHRTRILNHGISDLANRRFVASYDADVLLYPPALEAAMERTRAGNHMVLPFSGVVFDVRGSTRTALIDSLDFVAVSPSDLPARRNVFGSGEIVRVRNSSVGGAPIFDRRAFMECGGYNEKFISWGFEDNELIERFAKLGIVALRVAEFPLLHLAHPRGSDSSKQNPYYRNNVSEYRRMSRHSSQEVRALVTAGAMRLGHPPAVDRAGRLESMLWSFAARLGML
jgi:hypothetical protein